MSKKSTTCPDCGANKKIGRLYCTACAERRKGERIDNLQTLSAGGESVILKDPDEDGALETGSRIKGVEVGFMLTMGCFSPGTLVKRCGKIYQIVGEIDTRQRLVPCQEADVCI